MLHLWTKWRLIVDGVLLSSGTNPYAEQGLLVQEPSDRDEGCRSSSCRVRHAYISYTPMCGVWISHHAKWL